MRFSNAVGALAHDAMHRLPGMPDHARAGELNAHHQRRLRNRPLRNRPLRNRRLRNRPLRNQPQCNRPVHNPDGRHGRPARVLAGWQAWIGQRLRQGQR
jgi:hypothetical protein